MDIFLYIIIFIIGITFGSFYTLAVYRIPQGQDITHTHSYCPHCKHKLNIFDLIPILSYVFLAGKCRYCKKAIRPRYLILEIVSGIFFVIIAFLMGLNIQNLSIEKIMRFVFFVLYFTFVILIAGIDKEEKDINKSVLIYGIIISIIYIVYLYIVEKTNIYRYVIYLISSILLLVINNINFKKDNKNSYINLISILLLIMAIFTKEYITLGCIISMLFIMIFYFFLHSYLNVGDIIDNKNNPRKIAIGLYLSVFNIMYFIMFLVYRLCF